MFILLSQATPLSSVGLAAMCTGCVTLVLGAIAGWGIAGDPTFAPVRWLQRWLGFIVGRCLTGRPGWQRALVIFTNNTGVAAWVVASGGVGRLAWVATSVTGLALGGAVRLLAAREPVEPRPDRSETKGPDRWSVAGLLLNLLEIPAIVIALGLAFGQQEVPNDLTTPQVWWVFGYRVVPLLAVAATGEALWIVRLRVLEPPGRTDDHPPGAC